MGVPLSLAEDFFNLFAGLTRAYGRYDVPVSSAQEGKITGRAVTKREPLTVDLWARHIAGTTGIGIVPIHDDHTVRFAAIDVDVYPIDLKTLAARVKTLKLPLVLCRTKSGGAHLYLFTREAIPSAIVRARMASFAAALGYANAEIFPKQDRLETEEDVGNWINMPYFGGARSMRYAIAPDGTPIAIEDFVEYARACAVDLQELEGDDAVQLTAPPELKGAPPCLVTLAAAGFPAGSRNNALFNLAVYAKKAYPDKWQDVVRRFNVDFMSPALEGPEVETTLKSLDKKRYSYKCKDMPICAVCDRKTCLTREFGVGGGATENDAGIEFGELTRVLTKPVTWLWELDGEIIEFRTEDLMNQNAFQAKILEVLSVWPLTMKPALWRALVQTRVERAAEMAVPEDATMDGQLWEHLNRFCTSRVVGRSLDELLLGKPFTDDTRSYFVATDFLKYLSQHRFPGKMNERMLYVSLRPRGLEHHRSPLKGVVVSYWSLPAFIKQTEEHSVPKGEVKGAM